jgi:hypothetical protein
VTLSEALALEGDGVAGGGELGGDGGELGGGHEGEAGHTVAVSSPSFFLARYSDQLLAGLAVVGTVPVMLVAVILRSVRACCRA